MGEAAEAVGKVTLREADTEQADLRVLIAMANEMHSDSTFKPLPFDAQHFGRWLVDMIVGPQHLVLIVEIDGEVAGGVLASVFPAMFSPELVASEHAIFVRPEYRRSRAGQALIEAYLSWARDMGAKRVNAGNSAGMDDSRYVRLMQRFGFEKAGSLMYMTL